MVEGKNSSNIRGIYRAFIGSLKNSNDQMVILGQEWSLEVANKLRPQSEPDDDLIAMKKMENL